MRFTDAAALAREANRFFVGPFFFFPLFPFLLFFFPRSTTWVRKEIRRPESEILLHYSTSPLTPLCFFYPTLRPPHLFYPLLLPCGGMSMYEIWHFGSITFVPLPPFPELPSSPRTAKRKGLKFLFLKNGWKAERLSFLSSLSPPLFPTPSRPSFFLSR